MAPHQAGTELGSAARETPALDTTQAGSMEPPLAADAKRGAGRRIRRLWPVLALALVLLAFAIIEGDVPEEFSELAAVVGGFIKRYGAAAALGLLYIEESGVPLPVPGDVYVLYLGGLAAGSTPRLVATLLAIIAVVVAGSSNLYLISRRWGPRLIRHRLSSVFHLDPVRLAQVEEWFERWGPLVIIFGRHIPGFRIPVTVAAGTFGVPYRYFAPSVAVSTAGWAGLLLLLGMWFGRRAGQLLGSNPWIYFVGIAAFTLVVAVFAVRLWRAGRDS